MGEHPDTILIFILIILAVYFGRLAAKDLAEIRMARKVAKRLAQLTRIVQKGYPGNEILVKTVKIGEKLFQKNEILFDETLDPKYRLNLGEHDYWFHLPFYYHTSSEELDHFDLFFYDPEKMDPEMEITKFLLRFLGTDKVFVMAEDKKMHFPRDRFEFYTTPR